MTKFLSTDSEINSKNRIFFTLAILFFAGLLFLNLIEIFKLHKFQPLGIGIDIVFLVSLIKRIQGKYRCECHGNVLKFIQKNLWNTRTSIIEFSQIQGIYPYEPKLIGIMHFRRTFRFHSGLDNRKVWTIAYTVNKTAKEIENERIYFKPDANFLAELTKKLPGKINQTDKNTILANLQNN